MSQEEAETPLLINIDMLAARSVPTAERRDFEHGLSYFQPLTLFIIVVLIAVFVFEAGSGALASVEAITAAGAFKRTNVLAGEPWRLATAIFLHGGFDHVLGNCLALYVLGIAVEHAFSKVQMLLLFLGAGISGFLLSLALSEGPSVGASGAIFGLAGAMVMFFYRHRAQVYFREKRLGGVLVCWAAFTILIGLSSPMIDNWAHIGGLLAGLAFGLLPITTWKWLRIRQ